MELLPRQPSLDLIASHIFNQDRIRLSVEDPKRLFVLPPGHQVRKETRVHPSEQFRILDLLLALTDSGDPDQELSPAYFDVFGKARYQLQTGRTGG